VAYAAVAAADITASVPANTPLAIGAQNGPSGGLNWPGVIRDAWLWSEDLLAGNPGARNSKLLDLETYVRQVYRLALAG
jgi:hypothetical protein